MNEVYMSDDDDDDDEDEEEGTVMNRSSSPSSIPQSLFGRSPAPPVSTKQSASPGTVPDSSPRYAQPPLVPQSASSQPMKVAGAMLQPMVGHGAASQPMNVAGVMSQPMVGHGAASQPMNVAGTMSQPMVGHGAASQPMNVAGTMSQPMVRPGAPSQPMNVAGTMSQPMVRPGAPSQPMNVASSMPQLISQPPGFLQSCQHPSGATAFSYGMPVQPLQPDLAHMESVLQENPLLTDQVTGQIMQLYPLYAANPVALRFAVFNELQLLKKMCAEKGLPSVPAPPPTSSRPTPLTTISETVSAAKSFGGHTFAKSIGRMPVTSCTSSAATGIPHSSASPWIANDASSTSHGEQINPTHFHRMSSTSMSGTVASSTVTSVPIFTGSFGTAAVSRACSMAALAGRKGDGGMKRSAEVASTTATHPSVSGWTTSFSGSTAVDQRDPRHVTASASHTSTRSGGNGTLDTFAAVVAGTTGTLADFRSAVRSQWFTCQCLTLSVG